MSKLLIVHGILLLIGIFLSGPICQSKCSSHKTKCSFHKQIAKKLNTASKFLSELDYIDFESDDFIFEYEQISLAYIFRSQTYDILIPQTISIRAPPLKLS